ncbi:MAG: penicillin-binding protein 1C, partial [Bacteroidales bacterium]
YSSNGTLLDAKVSKDGQWRFKLSNDTLPDKLIKSLILFEDKRFFYHHGIDLLAIIRAFYLNIKNKRIISGGSTITMQVARMYFNSSKRSLFQKIKEILFAYYLELTMSKKEILKLYLENAPFGGNVIGAEAASWRYFGRPLSSLSWAESAMLAVIPNNPTNVNLLKNRIILKNKRNSLLKKMYESGIINLQTYEISIEEEIPIVALEFPHKAPHLLQFLSNKYPKRYVLYSTIDENLQSEAYRILLQYRHDFNANNIRNAALMIVDVHTGNVLTYIGNYHDKGKHSDAFSVNIIEAKRSGGSILKPFLYATMLDNGELLPEMLIPDVPTQIGSYAPKNFNRGYDGAVRAHMALARSLNVPAVKMLQWYGIQRFIDLLKKMGFTTINHSQDYYGLSLILGGCEIKMSELARAYAQMANSLDNNKKNTFKWSYLKDTSEMGITNFPIGKGASYLTLQAMVDVERPTDQQYWYLFKTKQKISWKTGTSFGFRDAWAIGINTDYLVLVWVGNATGEGSAELTGIKKAAPIMFDVFSILPLPKSWFAIPYDNLQLVNVCKQSGYPASMLCNDKITCLCPKTNIKVRSCPYHKEIFLDSTLQFRVHSGCESVQNMVKKIFFVLPPTMGFYYKKRNPWYKPLPPYRADCELIDIENKQNIEFVYPQQFTNVFITRNLDGTNSSLLFEVNHRYPQTLVFWYLDGKFIGQTLTKHQMAVNASMGKHILTVQDEFGESKQIEFNVLNQNP